MQNYFPNVIGAFNADENGNPSGGYSEINDPAYGSYAEGKPEQESKILAKINWQSGIMANGRNGAVLEDVVEVCIQRLRFFQDSKFRCRENAIALTKLEEAAQWMRQRQRNRAAQGVQSSYEVHSS